MGYETYVPLDKNVSFADQIEGDADGPITVVGTYAFANSKSLDEFVAIFSAVAGFMRAQPGFISAQVHRAIGGANVLVNHAIWESLDAYRAAVRTERENADLMGAIESGPADRVTWGVIVQKIAVPGLCVA